MFKALMSHIKFCGRPGVWHSLKQDQYCWMMSVLFCFLYRTRLVALQIDSFTVCQRPRFSAVFLLKLASFHHQNLSTFILINAVKWTFTDLFASLHWEDENSAASCLWAAVTVGKRVCTTVMKQREERCGLLVAALEGALNLHLQHDVTDYIRNNSLFF